MLHATLEQNLEMIRDTCAYLTKEGRNVMQQTQNTFHRISEKLDYALKTLSAAVEGGASVLILCETKGGCLPHECQAITETVVKLFASKVKVGIHTHNDSGLAVANSLIAGKGAGATACSGSFAGLW